MNNGTTNCGWTLRTSLVRRIKAEAESRGESDSAVVSRALAQYFASGRPTDNRHDELLLSPRPGSGVDQMMTWLLARRPKIGDVINSEGKVKPALRRAVVRALTEVQARRVLYRLEGLPYEAIGVLEDCSKQAVHQSIERGLEALSVDIGFVQVLCEMTESNFTGAELIAIARDRRGKL